MGCAGKKTPPEDARGGADAAKTAIICAGR